MKKYGPLSTIKPFVCIEVLIIQLFVYCFAGDLLSLRIRMIGLAVYESLWYELPIKLAEDTFFIMMRAGCPFILTAGKLLSMNMDTFSSILKVSLSYFSVLRLMLNA